MRGTNQGKLPFRESGTENSHFRENGNEKGPRELLRLELNGFHPAPKSHNLFLESLEVK